jgi:hypothetical protein
VLGGESPSLATISCIEHFDVVALLLPSFTGAVVVHSAMVLQMLLSSLSTALPGQWGFSLFGFDLVFRLNWLNVVLFLIAPMLFCCCVATAARRPRQEQIRFYDSMDFAELGFRMIGCKTRGTAKTRARRFKAHFGLEPGIAAEIWRELYWSGWLRYAGLRPNPNHLLFALVFLRCYCVEEIHATLCKTNVRTFRRWAWFYAEGIANLDKKYVSFTAAYLGNHLLD